MNRLHPPLEVANHICPSCPASMKPFQADGVELDSCSFCRGLWFDGGELEKMLGKRVQVEVCQADRGFSLDDTELIALNGGKRVARRTPTPTT